MSGNTPVGRLLPSFNLHLVPYATDSHNAHKTVSPGHALASLPQFHIYLIQCDVLETYALVVKKQIKAWLENIQQRKYQEWLVIHVTQDASARVASTSTVAQQKFLATIKANQSVFDRIRLDFNSGRKDRCVQVALGEALNDDNMWREVFEKIIDGVMNSFGAQLFHLQEDVRRLDSQRLMPGFNFCNFFLAKEALALSYERLSLIEEALIQYDELEAAYHQCIDSALQKDAQPWLNNFGGLDPMDDSANILNLDKKDYQLLISQNNISIFDFRTYLMACQAHLLLRLRRPVDVCARAKMLLPSMARFMRPRKNELPPYFTESWIFSTCLDIVAQCEESFPVSPNPNTAVLYESFKAELVLDARRQMDVMGRALGFLPKLESSTYLKLLDTEPKPLSQPPVPDLVITNKTMLNAFSSLEEFDEVYTALTQRAMVGFRKSSAKRFVKSLKCDLLNLHVARGHWDEAVELCTKLLGPLVFPIEKKDAELVVPDSQPPSANSIHDVNQDDFDSFEVPKYIIEATDAWNAVDSDALAKYAIAQKAKGNIPHLLDACLRLILHSAFLSFDEEKAVLETAIACARSTDTSWSVPSIPFFSARIRTSKTLFIENKLEVIVHSTLRRSFECDVVIVCASHYITGSRVTYHTRPSDSVSIQPGQNILLVDLTDDIAPDGLYIVDLILVRVGLLDVVCDPPPLTKINVRRCEGSPLVVFTAMESGEETIHCFGEEDQCRYVIVMVSTHQCDLTSMSVSVTGPILWSHLVLYALNDGKCLKVDSEAIDNGVVVKLDTPIPKESVVKIFIPSNGSDTEEKFSTIVELTDSKSVIRKILAESYVPLVKPLSCSQEVFFLDEIMHLAATVTNTHYAPIRIVKFSHIDDDASSYDIVPIDSHCQPTILFPGGSIRYLFHIKSKQTFNTDIPNVRFSVSYRSMERELLFSLQDHVSQVFSTLDPWLREFMVDFLYKMSFPTRDALVISTRQFAMNRSVGIVPPPPWLIQEGLTHFETLHVLKTCSKRKPWWNKAQEYLAWMLSEYPEKYEPLGEFVDAMFTEPVLEQLVKNIRDVYLSHKIIKNTREVDDHISTLSWTIVCPRVRQMVTMDLRCDERTLVQYQRVVFTLTSEYTLHEKMSGDTHLTVTFSLALDSKKWACCGHVKRTVTLEPSLPKRFQLTLVPLTSGHVEVPRLQFHQTADREGLICRDRHPNRRVFVTPPSLPSLSWFKVEEQTSSRPSIVEPSGANGLTMARSVSMQMASIGRLSPERPTPDSNTNRRRALKESVLLKMSRKIAFLK